MLPIKPAKLHDCELHGLGQGSELFIVEGDSASKSVVRVRNSKLQAVLPMQGKPLNALKASKSVVQRNELYQALIHAMGTDWGDSFQLNQLRYDRIIMLFDPDADGIHCGALLTMFFYRWMPALIASGHLCVIRPPLYEIASTKTDEQIHAYSDSQYAKLREELDKKGIAFRGQRYRGLASMSADALLATCLDPPTRNLSRIECEDAEAAVRIFGGVAKPK
jgi:DNA gyrase subunit B